VTERGKLDVPWSPEFSQKESVNYTDWGFIYCSLWGPNCTFYKMLKQYLLNTVNHICQIFFI
jgi:hypothetical protein